MKIKLEDLPSYGDHMTLKKFIEYCKDGCFIDYDGHGKYATKTKISNKTIVPSDITGRGEIFYFKTGNFKRVKKRIKIDKTFTHIVWFNR